MGSAGHGADAEGVTPMGAFQRYRFRVAVRHDLDLIWHPLRAGMSKMVLVSAFGAFQWRKALNVMNEGGSSSLEAAVAATCFALERQIQSAAPDRRKITLYALQTGNTSNHEANNYLAIADQVQAMGAKRAEFMSVIFTFTGALQGYFGEDLVNFRMAKLTEDVLTNGDQWTASHGS